MSTLRSHLWKLAQPDDILLIGLRVVGEEGDVDTQGKVTQGQMTPLAQLVDSKGKHTHTSLGRACTLVKENAF